jgi:hypothetical protein
MYPIDPGEDFGQYLVIGSNQTNDYEPLYARLTPENETITRWRLTESDKQSIMEGQDIFLSILQFGQPFHPVNLWVGA